MAPRHIFASPAAPETDRRPVVDEHHGIRRTDDYAWLRAGNWQEVFRDPDVLASDIRAHLEAENAYQEKLMADTTELQAKLFQEMKGRIKEDDSSVPMKDGPYAYGTSFKLGGQHPRYFRTPRDGGEQAIFLDGDAEAEGHPYFRIGGVGHSSDHKRLLWGFDDKGSEFFTLRVRDLATGADGSDEVPDTGGDGVWTADNTAFFYTRMDENHRPSKVFLHKVGTPASEDRLIFEETDPGFFVSVGGARQPLDLHLDPRSRDIGVPHHPGRRSAGGTEDRLAAPDRTPVRSGGRRRCLLHPDQCRRRQGFQDRHRAGVRSRSGQLEGTGAA